MDAVKLPGSEEAAAIALKALAFLAGDSGQLQRFLEITGMDVDGLRREADDPRIMASVLEFLAQDESLLITFTANAGLDPACILPAIYVLQNG